MLLLGSGCRPASVYDTPPDLTPDILLNRLNSETNRLQDLKGSALVTVRVKGQRGRVSSRILFRQPSHLMIYVYGAFMDVMAVLSLHDQAVQIYIPRENTVFEGTLADNDVVMPGMRVPLSDIRTAATGLVDLSKYRPEHVIQYRWEEGQYRLTVQNGETTRTAWINPKRSIITREEEQGRDGETTVRIFDKHVRQKGIWRPSRIRIVGDSAEKTLELIYNTQSLNSGLTIADITLRLPESVRRLPLSQAVFRDADG